MSRAGKHTAGSKGGKPCNRYEEQKEIQPVSEARKQVTFARVKKHATNAQHRELQPTLKKDKQQTPNSYYLDGISRFFLAH